MHHRDEGGAMKMMMIEAPDTCDSCPMAAHRSMDHGILCLRFDRTHYMRANRPQFCIDKDVEVEDAE